jgi:hypothetical protein
MAYWELTHAADSARPLASTPQSTNGWVPGFLRQLPDATDEKFLREGRLFAYNTSVEIDRCPAARGFDARDLRRIQNAVAER